MKRGDPHYEWLSPGHLKSVFFCWGQVEIMPECNARILIFKETKVVPRAV